jgi:hypothetical protein
MFCFEVFSLINARSLTQSPFRNGLISNRRSIAGVLAVLLKALFAYAPWISSSAASRMIRQAWRT